MHWRGSNVCLSIPMSVCGTVPILVVTKKYKINAVSYTHPPSPRDRQKSRMPSSA